MKRKKTAHETIAITIRITMIIGDKHEKNEMNKKKQVMMMTTENKKSNKKRESPTS